MDQLVEAEEQLASQSLRKILNEVNSAAQTQLAPIQDHVNFPLQKAYFKCAHDCFDRTKRQEQITSCVEDCSIPVSDAQKKFDHEMTKFKEKLNRSLMVCQDKYEAAKVLKKAESVNELVSCADKAIQDSISMLPHVAGNLKATLAIHDKTL